MRIGDRFYRARAWIVRAWGQCSECGAWLDGWNGGVCDACANR